MASAAAAGLAAGAGADAPGTATDGRTSAEAKAAATAVMGGRRMTAAMPRAPPRGPDTYAIAQHLATARNWRHYLSEEEGAAFAFLAADAGRWARFMAAGAEALAVELRAYDRDVRPPLLLKGMAFRYRAMIFEQYFSTLFEAEACTTVVPSPGLMLGSGGAGGAGPPRPPTLPADAAADAAAHTADAAPPTPPRPSASRNGPLSYEDAGDRDASDGLVGLDAHWPTMSENIIADDRIYTLEDELLDMALDGANAHPQDPAEAGAATAGTGNGDPTAPLSPLGASASAAGTPRDGIQDGMLGRDDDEASRAPSSDDETSDEEIHASLKWMYRIINREAKPEDLPELRTLLADVRPSRSKWLNEHRIGQEQLYEALEKVLNELKNYTEHSAPFLAPVGRREAPGYHDIIKRPMDLGTVTKKLQDNLYDTKAQFAEDLYQIWTNCMMYNTRPDSIYRKHATAMKRKTTDLLKKVPDIRIRTFQQDDDASEADDDVADGDETRSVRHGSLPGTPRRASSTAAHDGMPIKQEAGTPLTPAARPGSALPPARADGAHPAAMARKGLAASRSPTMSPTMAGRSSTPHPPDAPLLPAPGAAGDGEAGGTRGSQVDPMASPPPPPPPPPPKYDPHMTADEAFIERDEPFRRWRVITRNARRHVQQERQQSLALPFGQQRVLGGAPADVSARYGEYAGRLQAFEIRNAQRRADATPAVAPLAGLPAAVPSAPAALTRDEIVEQLTEELLGQGAPIEREASSGGGGTPRTSTGAAFGMSPQPSPRRPSLFGHTPVGPASAAPLGPTQPLMPDPFGFEGEGAIDDMDASASLFFPEYHDPYHALPRLMAGPSILPRAFRDSASAGAAVTDLAPSYEPRAAARTAPTATAATTAATAVAGQVKVSALTRQVMANIGNLTQIRKVHGLIINNATSERDQARQVAPNPYWPFLTQPAVLAVDDVARVIPHPVISRMTSVAPAATGHGARSASSSLPGGARGADAQAVASAAGVPTVAPAVLARRVALAAEPVCHDEVQAASAVYQSTLILMAHAGFEGCSKASLSLLMECGILFMESLYKTIQLYLERYGRRKASEEIVLSTLRSHGASMPSDIQTYIKNDVNRYGQRLYDLRRRLEAGFAGMCEELDQNADPDREDFRFEDAEEHIMSGNFFEEMGIDILNLGELGLGFRQVPADVWNRKSDRPIRARVKRTLVQPEPLESLADTRIPPLAPWPPVRPDAQIGLMQAFYAAKVAAGDMVEDDAKPPNKNAKSKALLKYAMTGKRRVAAAPSAAKKRETKSSLARKELARVKAQASTAAAAASS